MKLAQNFPCIFSLCAVSNPLLFFIRNCSTNSNQGSLIARIVSTFCIFFNGLLAFWIKSSQKRPHSDLPIQAVTPIKGGSMM
ncbi:hypothetical protein HYC85_028705 [Camellia sinensis]|uniref:Uncharacterized protein n=1 Tax=Camellia sinensis TaxID=4442 RepID=A0A7J7FZY1_CAMSI|nr:hypothetical protein HYC85_028705 [Camellia sinensis]